MDFSVTILGSASAVPLPGRHQTSLLVQVHEESYLLDCGEGAQMQLMKVHARPNRLRAIFISHLHPDHYLGLMGLLSTLTLRERTAPLTVVGPPGLEAIIETQRLHSQMTFPFPLHFELVDGSDEQWRFETPHLEVRLTPLQHRVPCLGYLLSERIHERPIRKQKLQEEMPPVEAFAPLKAGHDYVAPDGRRFAASEWTMPPVEPRRFAYATDTLYLPHLAEVFRGVDLLYHEATYLHDLADKAERTYHTTARQAAELAQNAGAGRLLLGHFSSRYRDLTPFLEEARAIFPQTYLAEEGSHFSIEAPRPQT